MVLRLGAFRLGRSRRCELDCGVRQLDFEFLRWRQLGIPQRRAFHFDVLSSGSTRLRLMQR